MPVMRQPHNIYIHVPFCISKCKYCAFFSTARQPDWDKYCTDICDEILQWSDKLGPVNIPTIFFGGGTPSLMPTGIFAKIITKISQCFHICPDCEITLESNPGTLDAARLDRFIAAGVNRLSVGVQSLDDGELEFLGRRHTAAEALRLINAAHARNIKLSADFIYGLPGHTTETVAKLCRGINQIGLGHCSLYELTIEPATPFGKMNLAMPSNSNNRRVSSSATIRGIKLCHTGFAMPPQCQYMGWDAVHRHRTRRRRPDIYRRTLVRANGRQRIVCTDIR